MPSRFSIFSNMMRKKTSSQLSPACIATPGGLGELLGVADRGEQVDAGMALEGLGHGQPLGLGPGIAAMIAASAVRSTPVSASSAAQSSMIAS